MCISTTVQVVSTYSDIGVHVPKQHNKTKNTIRQLVNQTTTLGSSMCLMSSCGSRFVGWKKSIRLQCDSIELVGHLKAANQNVVEG